MANELPLQMLIYEDEQNTPYTIYVQSQDAAGVDPDRLQENLQEKQPSGDRPGRGFGDIPIDEEPKNRLNDAPNKLFKPCVVPLD